MRLSYFLLFVWACTFLSCRKPHTSNEPPADNGKTAIEYATMVDTTYNLLIFRPEYQRLDLVCGAMPSTSDSSVIFCAAAAFTNRIQDTFTYDNIVGAYITHGQHHLGYQAGKHYGRFVYADKRWNFISNSNHDALDSTASKGGCAFTQMWVVKDGEIYKPYARKDSTQRNIYRCICERNDTLMIAQCRNSIPYHIFVKALKVYRMKNALYMDMGTGWNHSFYRDNNDSLHIIFPKTHNYCTNWLTFYK